MKMAVTVDRVKRWGLKGGMGIVDQGLYSGVNFLLSVMLGRWISPEMYGGFSAAYSLFLLVSIGQVALIAEPMSIFGAGAHRRDAKPYLNYLLRLQWLGTLVATVILLVLAFFVRTSVLREALVAMALALPFIFFYWYLRRAFYIETQSGAAMLASLAYATLLVLLCIVFRVQGSLSASTAYLAMAISSTVAAVFALKRLGLRFFGQREVDAGLEPGSVSREHWDFGKWILPAYLAGWLTSLSFPFFITILVNPESAGAFRALQNLFLPLQQLLAALTLLLLPWLSRQASDFGRPRLFTVTEKAAGAAGLAAAAYCLLVVVFRREIVSLLYASDYYQSFDHLVIYLALSTILVASPLVLGLALRVAAQPSIILWSKGGAAVFAVLVGVPMMRAAQMDGVVVALVGSAVLETILLLLLYVRAKKDVDIRVVHKPAGDGRG